MDFKTIKKNYMVEKLNLLNEVQNADLSLEELRFFCIYLSKINARDPRTRVVRFSIDDFQKILGLGKANYVFLERVAEDLLKKIIVIPRKEGPWKIERRLCIFSTCEIGRNEATGKGYVTINAHDEALPLLFEFKNRYFCYEIWNALRLKSAAQIRMFEILKQYEQIGERIVTISALKALLGIQKDAYPRYNNFRARVLEPCRIALAQRTDIQFSYEPHGVRGRGGKIDALHFVIKNNKDFDWADAADPVLQEFLRPWLHEAKDLLKNFVIPDRENLDERYVSAIENLALACQGEFDFPQIQKFHLMIRILFRGEKELNFRHYDYLEEKYNAAAGHSRVRNRFAYIRFLIEMDMLNEHGGPEDLKKQFGYLPTSGARKAYRRDAAENDPAF